MVMRDIQNAAAKETRVSYDDFLIFSFLESPMIISGVFFLPPPSRDVDLSKENIINLPQHIRRTYSKYNMSNSPLAISKSCDRYIFINILSFISNNVATTSTNEMVIFQDVNL